MRFANLLLVLTIILVFASSCSKKSNPVLPVDSQDRPSSEQISISDSSISTQTNLYRGVFGAWQVHIDWETLTAELIPARNAQTIGDIFDADLLQFLTVSPCSNCLTISGLTIRDDEYLRLDLQMKHPFPNLTARPDLHGFDVRAIFITDWINVSPGSLMMTKPDGTEEQTEYHYYFVFNPDGFTSHYDELVNDERYFINTADCPGNLNPYIRFFEDPSMGTFDPAAPAGYNVMPTGAASETQTAIIHPAWLWGEYNLYIVADVAYGHSATYKNRDDPQYYLPNYNRTEPWRMEYWLENNNLKWDDTNSSTDIVVQVFDWQHNADVDANYPDPANLSGLRESSKVSQVELHMPSLKADPVILTTPDSGDGTPANPLQYRFTIKNELLGYQEIQSGLIAIRDELYGQASPNGRYPVPENPAGFPYETLDIQDYSYYGIITVNLTDTHYGTDEFQNAIEVESSKQYGYSGVRPEVTFFMDPSHELFLYEWDFLFDGITFNVDGTGWPCPYIDFTDPELPGKRMVGMRITTNSVPPQQYIYEIPVYARGQEYFHTFTGHGNTNITTAIGQAHAVYATEDKFYVAYTSKESGVRNIYLSAVDRYSTGAVNTAQVTFEGIEDCYNPAFTVVEDGDVDKIYVLFKMNDGAFDSDLYSTHNSDGLDGFIVANIEPVDTDNSFQPHQPSIIFVNNTLYAYYRNWDQVTFESLIRRAKSTTLGNTWTGHENLDDSGGSYQGNPSIGYMDWGGYIYCVWEDNRNYADYGIDLYIEMFDGSYSSAFILIENRENVDETDPSVAVSDETLGIAYLEKDGTKTTVWLKTMRGSSRPGCENYIQAFIAPLSCASPSLAICANNQFTVAFSQYNTDTSELKSHVRQYYESEPYGHMQYSEIENEIIGLVPAGGGDAFHGVACRRVADGYGIEHFVARKSYTSGYQDDGGTYYGLIDVICHISYGDENDPW